MTDLDQPGAAHRDGPTMTSGRPAADFEYELPDEAVAQHPVEPRDSARLLDATGDRPFHRRVRDLDSLVGPGDVLVVNDTRVLRARLVLHKATGGAVELLLLEPTGRHGEWQALVRPGRRVPPGTRLYRSDDGEPLATVGAVLSDGRRLVTVSADAMATAGQVPLPPYITAPLDDPDRYQTVYARRPGSVAAPTAGLHLTEDLLARIRARGAQVVPVELVVGLGTFRPITTDDVADHAMHQERYAITDDAWRRIEAGRRVLAVGTTVVRALESAAATGQRTGSTDLFIRAGFDWRVVDLLLTNFHVPRSSLLVMIDAFVGDRWREIYRCALDCGYRFLSFGDCMLLSRHPALAERPDPVPEGHGADSGRSEPDGG